MSEDNGLEEKEKMDARDCISENQQKDVKKKVAESKAQELAEGSVIQEQKGGLKDLEIPSHARM